MNAKQAFLQAVKDGATLEQAAARSNAPNYVCFIWARQAGIAVPELVQKIGTRNQKIGLAGERLFQELVPEAANMNTKVRANHPDYDFCYKGLKIDIKASIENARKSYHFAHMKPNCDLYVCFALKSDGGLARILVLPAFFFEDGRLKDINVSTPMLEKRFKDFVCEPSELKESLDLMAGGFV